MTYVEIVEAAPKAGLLDTDGRTPNQTLNSMLNRRSAESEDASGFRKVRRGLFELSEAKRSVR